MQKIELDTKAHKLLTELVGANRALTNQVEALTEVVRSLVKQMDAVGKKL
jgi:hypothetical protein